MPMQHLSNEPNFQRSLNVLATRGRVGHPTGPLCWQEPKRVLRMLLEGSIVCHMNVQFPGLGSRLVFYLPRDRGFPTSRRSPISLTSCVITTRSARVRLPADAAYLPCAALDLEGVLEERHACTLPARRTSSAPLQTP